MWRSLVFNLRAGVCKKRALWRQLSSSPSSHLPNIGFVGLGNMGLPMSIHLAKDKDSNVVAYDTNNKAMRIAEDAGITRANSIEEIGAAQCSIIFTMLPGCAAVDLVTSVLLDSAQSESSIIFVDCSTVHPSTSRRWHEELEARGHARIDAPVSGGVKGAQDGALTFMVGCKDMSALKQAQPYLDILGKRTIECGGPGAGSATKLCNNLALAAQMVGICEAMNLGESLGVDPVVLADVMNTSTAKSWSCEVNNPHPLVGLSKGGTMPSARQYEGGFGTKLMLKDLTLAVNAGAETGVALPLGTASKELYQLAALHGLGKKDFGVILQFLRGKTDYLE